MVGSGTFGVVFKGQTPLYVAWIYTVSSLRTATDGETGETVALKKIKIENPTQGFPVTVRIIQIYDTH